MKHCVTILGWLLVLLGCSPTTKILNEDAYKKYRELSFCDFPANIGKDVIIEGVFGGSDKDYMFFGPSKNNCANLPPLCLDFRNYDKLPTDVREKYMSVRSNYQTTYLVVKGVGQFISYAKCGHLGAYEHAFVMKEVINMEVRTK